MKERNQLSEEQRKLVAAECANGRSVAAVCAMFSISRKTVDRILRAHGVSMHTGRRPSRELNHAAFDQITPGSAYWAGFLFADGSIIDDGQGAPKLALHLSQNDRAHVEKFRAFIGSTHAITTTKSGFGGIGADFKVRSQRLVDALMKLGMSWKKPDRTPADEISNSRDFWRGVCDADGSTWESLAGNASFSLCGHIPMLTAFQNFLRRSRLVNLRVGPTESGIFRLGTEGTTALVILRALYGNTDESVALTRKLSTARKLGV